MAWIELHQSVWTHKKTVMLAALVDIDEIYAAAHMTKLWTWALDNAPDGSLSGLPNKVIAFGAGWKGDADQFVDALVQAGWLDETEEGLIIHDWYDYAGRLIERREANKERMRKARASKKTERATNVQRTNEERAEHVQGLPNHTVPNQNNIADSDEIGETFERFWKAYPKKQGKQAALKKWRSLYKQGKIDIDFILDRLQAYIAYVEAERRRGFNRQFMDGSTFVNQERWNDDWGTTQPRDPTDHVIELNKRMRDRNEKPVDWLLA